MAKTRACDVAMRIADRAIQVLGGYGFTTDFPVERAYRDAAVLKLLQGSGAWHRVRIARSLAR
jgi:alkylation response protein AidB-like acyl-CoA dehydrogenase